MIPNLTTLPTAASTKPHNPTAKESPASQARIANLPVFGPAFWRPASRHSMQIRQARPATGCPCGCGRPLVLTSLHIGDQRMAEPRRTTGTDAGDTKAGDLAGVRLLIVEARFY